MYDPACRENATLGQLIYLACLTAKGVPGGIMYSFSINNFNQLGLDSDVPPPSAPHNTAPPPADSSNSSSATNSRWVCACRLLDYDELAVTT
jgi:hypothetical protein